MIDKDASLLGLPP